MSEVTLIVEARGDGDLGDGSVGAAELPGGVRQPQPPKALSHGFVKLPAEPLGEVCRVNSDFTSDL